MIGGLRVAEHKKAWHLILDRLTAPLTTGSVCVSRGVLRFSREVAKLNPAQLTVIPNGIDPQPFDFVEPPVSRASMSLRTRHTWLSGLADSILKKDYPTCSAPPNE